MLTPEQKIRYETLKARILLDIEEGLQAFERAGRNILIVRDERLYRDEFETFDEFCRTILGHSKTYANNLIVAYELIQALIHQGITVLPDGELVARQLARFPKELQALIWKRALQLAGRHKPTYKTVRDAAMEIIPSKQQRKIWLSEFLAALRLVKKKLSISLSLQGVSRESMEEIALLLVDIEKRIAEISIEVGRRIEELEREDRS